MAYIYVGSTIVLIHLSFTLCIQEPEKIVLGRYHKKIRKGSKLVDIEKEDKAYYVPILKSIQQLLTNDAVVEEVKISFILYQFVDFQFNSMSFNHCKLNIQIDNPHNRDDGLLGDYCDGEEFRTHPLFSNDRYVWFYSLF